MTVSYLDAEHSIASPQPIPLRKLLYATDISSGSEPAMQAALELREDFSAELMVLHVMRDAGWGYGAEFLPTDIESRMVQAREAAFEFLVNLVPAGAREDPKVRVEIREGVPYEEILAVADAEGVDLIVLNTQSRSGLDRALLGSTAERVVRGAHVPVLSIPSPEDGA
jgi:nucleotide-binding universal stress UspA family protein